MENTLLNLIPAAYLPEIHLSQYDIGRTLTFTLKDGASDYSVPSGASVKVKATKPSGFGFEVACTFNGGTVTLVTTETMTPENGRFPAELSIVSGNTTIGTSNFIFNIERSPHPEGTTDGDAETIIPELTLLVERIEAAADSVDEDTQIVTDAKAEVLQAKADTLQAKADTLSARDESVSAKDLAVSSAQTSVEASERAEELIGSVSTKADAIIKTASGSIASFDDGGDDLPLKSLLVNIEPKQSGSGDPSPSNVRPISGYSEVVTSRVGKNLLKVNEYANVRQYGLFNYALGDSSIAFNQLPPTQHWPNLWISFDGIPTGTPITFSGTYTNPNSGATPNIALGYVDPNDANFSTYADITKKTISTTGSGTFSLTGTIPDGKLCALRMTPSNSNDASMVTQVFKVEEMQIELGSTVTAYEPYNGTTYTTSLGQTVYGGVLDVVSGKLTIIKNGVVYNGSESWGFTASSGRNRVNISLSGAPQGSYNLDIKGNYIKASSEASSLPLEWQGNINNLGALLIGVPTSITSADSWKSYLASNPLTVVYPLATPTEIQLTPTQVKTLLGNNNIWANSGTVEVEYRADTTLAYNELLSLIASLS